MREAIVITAILLKTGTNTVGDEKFRLFMYGFIGCLLLFMAGVGWLIKGPSKVPIETPDEHGGEPVLLPDEHLLREDLVRYWLGGASTRRRLARMLVTNRRLLFLEPDTPSFYATAALLSTGRNGSILTYPLTEPQAIRCENVKRFWTWDPEFSGAPAAQVGNWLVHFELCRNKAPFWSRLPIEDVRAHFQVVHDAWAAATQPPSPAGETGTTATRPAV